MINPIIHSLADYDLMRKAGCLASKVLDYITPYVLPGVSTETLNEMCHKFIINHNAIPAPLNYNGFPKSICTSVNHVVCHGIPSKSKILRNGDIINIDVTVILEGWHGDTSRMFSVGKVDLIAQRLIDVTYDCMMLGINSVKPGSTIGNIGYAIQSHAENHGFSVVKDFCGHGIGRSFHTSPEILHFGKQGTGLRLEEGMFFTIEPMINVGRHFVKILKDGWTVVTKDKSLSAQFEHTLGVTSNGFEIFTLS